MRLEEAWSPYSRSIGLEIVSATPDRIEASLVVPPNFANRSNVMHGGAIMAVGDVMGGLTTLLNLGPDQRTTTIESKTNFFRPAQIGERIAITCIPLHRGRRTMVLQTSIVNAAGKPAATITQTQLLMPIEGDA